MIWSDFIEYNDSKFGFNIVHNMKSKIDIGISGSDSN